MVTYCLGSARQKRAYFARLAGAVVLDNQEVLFCASENGRNYFAFGEVPFASFTAEQYVKYKLALVGAERTKDALELLSRLDIPRGARLGGLVPARRACIEFTVKKCGNLLDRHTVIDLDGVRCTRKNRKALARLLSVCPDAYVCVCDRRFLKYAPAPFGTLEFGNRVKAVRPKFYAAKRLAKRINAYKIAVM